MGTTNEELQATIKAQAVKTRDAARILSVTPKTLRDLANRGLIRPNRKCRHLLWPIEEIQKFLKS